MCNLYCIVFVCDLCIIDRKVFHLHHTDCHADTYTHTQLEREREWEIQNKDSISIYFTNLMAYKQCHVTVMLNKRCYSSDIAVFDMITVILPNAFNFFQDHDTIRLSYVNEML